MKAQAPHLRLVRSATERRDLLERLALHFPWVDTDKLLCPKCSEPIVYEDWRRRTRVYECGCEVVS